MRPPRGWLRRADAGRRSPLLAGSRRRFRQAAALAVASPAAARPRAGNRPVRQGAARDRGRRGRPALGRRGPGAHPGAVAGGQPGQRRLALGPGDRLPDLPRRRLGHARRRQPRPGPGPDPRVLPPAVPVRRAADRRHDRCPAGRAGRPDRAERAPVVRRPPGCPGRRRELRQRGRRGRRGGRRAPDRPDRPVRLGAAAEPRSAAPLLPGDRGRAALGDRRGARDPARRHRPAGRRSRRRGRGPSGVVGADGARRGGHRAAAAAARGGRRRAGLRPELAHLRQHGTRAVRAAHRRDPDDLRGAAGVPVAVARRPADARRRRPPGEPRHGGGPAASTPTGPRRPSGRWCSRS